MLEWTKITRRQYGGTSVSTSYTTNLPGWGRVTVHPCVHCPGELYLTCDSLGIEMYPLGQTAPEDALKPAEAELVRMLIQYVTWCAEALSAIHNDSTNTDT